MGYLCIMFEAFLLGQRPGNSKDWSILSHVSAVPSAPLWTFRRSIPGLAEIPAVLYAMSQYSMVVLVMRD